MNTEIQCQGGVMVAIVNASPHYNYNHQQVD